MEEDEFLTPADLRRIEKEKRREENRRKFQLAKEKNVKAITAREPVGTRAGNKQRMQEFKDKLLTAHNGTNVIRKVLEIAMNDEHPGQINALKLCMDRMLPTSMFDDMKKVGDKPQIQINITGIGESPVNVIEGEVLDG